MKLENIDYYLVTDSALSKKGTESDVELAIEAGCKIVQYREKNKSTKEMIEEAKKLKEICRGRAIFLINDRVDVAIAVDADGVHIGQEDMPIYLARKTLEDKIIGVSVHNEKEAIDAQAAGADYVGLGPIYPTSTKKDAGAACGTEMIVKVRNAIYIPIVVIGGINKDNVAEVIRAGADSAVAISAVLAADDVGKEVRDFIGIIKYNK